LKGLGNVGDVDLRDRYRSDDEGHFRIPTLPGRGIVGVLVQDSDRLYSRGAGAEGISGAKNDIGMSYFNTEPSYCMPSNFNTLAEVNPTEDAERVEVNFALDSGGRATGRVVDQDGKPLSDYRYSGKIPNFATWEQSKQDTFEVIGLDPSRPRRVLFYHKDRRLAGTLIIGESAPQDLVVKLQLAGKVVGRLVDEDGSPLAEIMLNESRRPVEKPANMQASGDIQPTFVALPPNLTHSRSAQYATDKEGRFEIDGLVPGIEYRLSGFDRDAISPAPGRMSRVSGQLEKVIVTEAGQTLDLGDVRLVKETKPKATTTSASAKATDVGDSQAGKKNSPAASAASLPKKSS